MTLNEAMDVAVSSLSANRVWMERIASNLANANTTRSSEGGPYQRQIPVFAEVLAQEVGSPGGVEVIGVSKDPSLGAEVYNPGHPDADGRGFVRMPNVNVVTEMVDMIAASRSYEAGTTLANAIKTMGNKAVENLGK